MTTKYETRSSLHPECAGCFFFLLLYMQNKRTKSIRLPAENGQLKQNFRLGNGFICLEREQNLGSCHMLTKGAPIERAENEQIFQKAGRNHKGGAKVNMKQTREWYPFIGPFDPCPPKYVKTYVIPPNQFYPYQPMNLPQFSLEEAIKLGTLWPALFSPYESKCGKGESQ